MESKTQLEHRNDGAVSDNISTLSHQTRHSLKLNTERDMADYDERYEGNGEEEELHNSLPHPHPQPDSSPHPTHDDLTDSKSHVCTFSISLSASLINYFSLSLPFFVFFSAPFHVDAQLGFFWLSPFP